MQEPILCFLFLRLKKKAFAVTSYSKGEGKSTVASNLAISFSKMESKVLLVDCDLRRPNVHNIFKIDNTKGLADVIGKILILIRRFRKMFFPDLISHFGLLFRQTRRNLCVPQHLFLWFRQLKEEYDYIIFDTPPIGVVADALLLKELIAGFIVVVRKRVITHGDLRNLTESIKLADSRVLGIVKVGCSQNERRKGKYYYKYYYNYY